MKSSESSAQDIVFAVFQPTTVGSRMRSMRLRSGKSVADLTTSLSLGNETQYLDIESSRSPLEKYGVIVGRLAVRFGVPVVFLLDGGSQTRENNSVGLRIARLRQEVSLTILDVCRHLTVKRSGRNFDELESEGVDGDENDGTSFENEASVHEDDDNSDDEPSENLRLSTSPELQLFVTEKEMQLIESGSHVLFERWMTILSAFCRVTRCDPFCIVMGV